VNAASVERNNRPFGVGPVSVGPLQRNIRSVPSRPASGRLLNAAAVIKLADSVLGKQTAFSRSSARTCSCQSISKALMGLNRTQSRAFQFGQKSFYSIRFDSAI